MWQSAPLGLYVSETNIHRIKNKQRKQCELKEICRLQNIKYKIKRGQDRKKS